MLCLRGETGATLDAERVTPESLNIEGMKMRLASLAPEELTWRVKSSTLAAGDTTLPDLGQKVSLYLDEVRLFHGHVISREVTGYGVTVKVAGPWWWLQRQDATSDQDDEESTTAERPVLAFTSQGWDASIEALMDKAENGYGLPVTVGTIPSFNDLPYLRYKLTSLADVLTRLMQWCADAVAWWDHRSHTGDCQAATSTTLQLAATASATSGDYVGLEIEIRDGANAGETRTISAYDGATKTATVSTAWTTTPTAGDAYSLETKVSLNVTRRGSASATTYTLGTDPVIDPLSFRPRVELEVTRVEIPYVDRDGSTDALQWQEQVAGTLTAAKRQIVTVSGPELNDFLPPTAAEIEDFLVDIDSTTNNLETAVRAAFPAIDELLTEYSGSIADFHVGSTSGGTNWGPPYPGRDIRFTGDPDAEAFEGSATYRWTNPTFTGRKFIFLADGIQPPDWAIADYGLQPYNLKYVAINDGNSVGSTPVFNAQRRTDILRALGQVYYLTQGASDISTMPSGTDYMILYRLFADGESGLWTIATGDIPVSGTLTRGVAGGEIYTFWSPPSGLASAMLAASSWIPWEGSITRQVATLTAEQPFSRKYSIAGTISDAASAAALPRAYVIDFESSQITLELGPPDRLDYRTLVQRTERRGSENIVEL